MRAKSKSKVNASIKSSIEAETRLAKQAITEAVFQRHKSRELLRRAYRALNHIDGLLELLLE